MSAGAAATSASDAVPINSGSPLPNATPVAIVASQNAAASGDAGSADPSAPLGMDISEWSAIAVASGVLPGGSVVPVDAAGAEDAGSEGERRRRDGADEDVVVSGGFRRVRGAALWRDIARLSPF